MQHHDPESQATNDDAPKSPRLQTYLERVGVASRRKSAEIIQSGAVTVNGEVVTQPGFRLQNPDTDIVCVDGETLPQLTQLAPRRTVMFNKPKGLICSSDDSQGETIYKYLSFLENEKLVPVGRLDKESEGLILLSNDGELVNTLTHPKFGHSKEYEVVAGGQFDQRTYDLLHSPMKMDGYTIQPVEMEYVARLKDSVFGPRHRLWFRLREGRNRQIRNMCELAGLKIVLLKRVAINGLQLPRDLKQGEWRDLSESDWENLMRVPEIKEQEY